MDVDPAFVADGEASELVKPCEAALDHPAIAAEPLAGLDASPGYARLDPTAVTGATAAPMVVGFVGVQLVRPSSRSAALARDMWHGIEQFLERHAVVDVGAGQQKGERDAAAICDQVAFGARPASIGRVGTSRGAPFLAAMEELSMHARLQSMRSASRSRRNSSRCRRSQTPAACQSRSRLQHVTPDPQPISAGSISHGMPVRSTNRMPVNAARAGTGGRPPFGLGGAGGSSGSMISQSDSGRRGEAISPHESAPIRVQGF
jgi:hypothetical protein